MPTKVQADDSSFHSLNLVRMVLPLPLPNSLLVDAIKGNPLDKFMRLPHLYNQPSSGTILKTHPEPGPILPPIRSSNLVSVSSPWSTSTTLPLLHHLQSYPPTPSLDQPLPPRLRKRVRHRTPLNG